MAIENFDNTTIDVQTLKPFKKFIMTIGELPTNYIDSLSYAELLTWFCDYLQNKVIPVVDTNAAALKELQDYFNNLDVQDEIDNKLDEMAEDGTLEEIMASYLNTKAIFCFDNVNDLKNATNLIDGSYAKTLGFYSINDDGGATYKIRTITNQDVVDNASIIALNDESLIAELIIVDIINIKQFGAIENEDNTSIFNKVITYNRDKKYRIYIPKGTYYVSQILIDYENSVIFGDSKALSIIKSIENNTEDSIIKVVNSANKRNEIFNIKIDGNKNNNVNEIDGIKLTSNSEYFTGDDSYNKIHDIEITLCSGNGLTAESSYLRELRIDNIRCVYNKNGFNINGITDSIINNCTASSNDEYGYYIKAFNMRISNCKAHHNGKGSENSSDLDYTRVPLNEFEATSDEDPIQNKTYYTISDLGVVEKFTGTTFESGTTYYELNKLYYKRYPGFYLETYRSNINNIESQDNFGDGLYVNGGRNNISNIVGDNNGIIIINGTPVSYASQNLEQLYDGVHLYRTTNNNILGSFTNSRNASIGKSQRSGLYIDSTNYYDGETNAQIICENQVSDVLTKNIGSNGVIKVDINGKQYYEVCNNSDIQVYGGSVYSTGDIISSIKKYGDRINLHLILNKPEGFIKEGTSSDSYIGKIPAKYRPKENINIIGMLSDNKGYTQNAYCTCTITPNGDIRIRNTGSTAYPDLIITAEY